MAKYTKKLWKPEYQKILVYAEQGMKQKDIAEKIGMTKDHVSVIMRGDEFKKRQSIFEEKIIDRARKVFEEHAEAAAKKIVKIAKGGKSEDRIQLDASKEVLYQVGMKPKEVIETINRQYTPEELESMQTTALELEKITERLENKDSRFLLRHNAKPPIEQTGSS